MPSQRTSRRRRQQRFSALLAAGVGVAAVIGIVSYTSDTSTQHRVTPPPPLSFALWAADSHGSVVEDAAHKMLIGYVGSTQAWKRSESDLAGVVVCLKQCPDVSISGSSSTDFQPEKADPPVLFGGQSGFTSEDAHIAGGTGKGKTLIWAAQSSELATLVTADLQGNSKLELRDAPNPPLRVPLPELNGLGSIMWGDVTLSHVLALQLGDGPHPVARWFTRGDRGWALTGETPSAAHQGCLSADGSRAVLSSDSGTQLVDFGSSSGVPLSGGAGLRNCLFDSEGPITTAGSSDGRQVSTVLTQYDQAGKQLWQQTVPFAGTASTSNQSADVAISGLDHLSVFDSHGTSLLQRDDVKGAMIVGARSLVTIGAAGTPGTTTLAR